MANILDGFTGKVPNGVSIEANVYGNLNNHGTAIISYDESNKFKHPRGYIERISIQLPP